MQAGIVEAGYGSDPVGLVSGFLFAPGGAVREIDSRGAAAWLQQAPPDAAHDRPFSPFLWLHFNLSHNGCWRPSRARFSGC